MKFEEHKFSRRYSPLTCAIFVVHESPTFNGQLVEAGIANPSQEALVNRAAYRGTAAAIILPDGRFWVGVCLCSPNDQYIKAVGRQKAIGRAFAEMQACRNGPDVYLEERGRLDFADHGTTPEGRHWIDDLKFCLSHEITLKKQECRAI